MITLKKITKKFDDNLVLDKIDLEIKQGEIVGFLGPNGAGKTTTMRMITGYLKPTAGKILINAKNIEDIKNSTQFKKDIGYLPENNPLYQDMLVFEYLKVMAELKQIASEKIKTAIREVVKKTGVEEVYYKAIADLSKGFKQRVGLAATILGDPKILILDEPTEGLDPNQRIDIRNLIKNLGQDKTVIISSHVLSEIENTCDKIIIINKGKVVANGKTEEIINGAKGKKELFVEIAGEDVSSKVKELVAEKNIKIVKNKNNRWAVNLTLEAEQELRPVIFELAKKNNWVIWEMHQKEMNLEDAFHQLTL